MILPISLFCKFFPRLQELIDLLKGEGVTIFIVGGALRDILVDPSALIKELDLEVYGLSIEQIEFRLRENFYIKLVGKVYGVLRLSKENIDISVPRIDGPGRKPSVSFFSNFEGREACKFVGYKRRDLTINSLMCFLYPTPGILLDQCGGVQDLKSKILRAVDENLFPQDPLRLFRVMRYISVLGMKPCTELTELCSQMDIAGVAYERIFQELRLVLISDSPTNGLRWLYEIGVLLKLYPYLASDNEKPFFVAMQYLTYFSEQHLFCRNFMKQYEIAEKWRLPMVLSLLIKDATNLSIALDQLLKGLYQSIRKKVLYLCSFVGKLLTCKEYINSIDIIMLAYDLHVNDLNYKIISPFLRAYFLSNNFYLNFEKKISSLGLWESCIMPFVTGRHLEKYAIPKNKRKKFLENAYRTQIEFSLNDAYEICDKTIELNPGVYS